MDNKKNKIVPPETGSVVIMDVKNGQIICSVSTPHFNPNIFSLFRQCHPC